MRSAAPVLLLLAGLALSIGGTARADDPQEAERRAAAQVLFDEGTKALDAGRYQEACPKLAEVVKLQPAGVGAKLTLGECYERWGRLASAFAVYSQAETAAGTAGQQERATTAANRARDLGARVSRLTIDVPDSMRALPGLEVWRDDISVGVGQWGVALPVDGGKHTVRAAAPGHHAWSTTVDVPPEKGALSVQVATLTKQGAAAPSGSGADQPSALGAERPVWPWIVGGVGVALLGGAAFFGIDGLRARSELETECEDLQCGPEVSDSELASMNARKNRDLALFLGLGGAGAAAVTVALVGLVSTPTAPRAGRLRVLPSAGAGAAGFVAAGSF